MFRSVSNMEATSCKSLQGRQRHDFVDDLESFFWVYVWMMTIHNGPGAEQLVPKSERNESAIRWETSLDNWFHYSWKDYYLEVFGGKRFRVFTPYFSEPVYLALLHSFRKLLYEYWRQKMERLEAEDKNRPELDFFPEMEEIYENVLGYFDVAIETLAPTPKPAPRIQPNRQVKKSRGERRYPPVFPKPKRKPKGLFPVVPRRPPATPGRAGASKNMPAPPILSVRSVGPRLISTDPTKVTFMHPPTLYSLSPIGYDPTAIQTTPSEPLEHLAMDEFFLGPTGNSDQRAEVTPEEDDDPFNDEVPTGSKRKRDKHESESESSEDDKKQNVPAYKRAKETEEDSDEE